MMEKLSVDNTGVSVERGYFVYSNPSPPPFPQKCCSHQSKLFFFGGGEGRGSDRDGNTLHPLSLRICPMTEKQIFSYIYSGWLS